MCEIMEELCARAAARASARADAFARKDNAVKMLKRNKLSFEEIAEDSGLTLEEVKALAAEAKTHETPVKI